MSKAIDFTKPGGFPLTQDELGYLQAAWQEVVNQLVGLGVNGSSPTILSGMVSSTSGSTVTVSAGWFAYNGAAVRFPSQTYTTPVTGGDAMYIVVTPTATPLTFNDGSTPNVVLDSTGVLTMLVNTTPVDSTHFLLSSLVPWSLGRAWTDTPALTLECGAGGTVTLGTVAYSKYRIEGKTFYWSFKITGCTITGAPLEISVVPSTPLGITYANLQGIVNGNCSFSGGGGILPLMAWLGGLAGDMAIEMAPTTTWASFSGSTPFIASSGDVVFDFTIVAEIV